MIKIRPLLLLKPLSLAVAFWPLATPALAATLPYTDWVNDYTGAEAHTIGLWKFDNPDPTANSSTNEAYVRPNATFHKTGTQTGVAGKFGEAFLSSPKSGADNSYAGFTSTPFNGSAISVEFWYSPLSTPPGGGSSYSYFFDKMYTDDSGMMLILTSGNTLRLTVGNGTSKKGLNPSTVLTLTPGEWYHFAVTYENIDGDGTARIFFNGTEIASQTWALFGDLDAGTRGWRLGNRAGSSYSSLPGYYDNFRISDVAYNFQPIPEPGTAASLALLFPLLWSLRRTRLLSPLRIKPMLPRR